MSFTNTTKTSQTMHSFQLPLRYHLVEQWITSIILNYCSTRGNKKDRFWFERLLYFIQYCPSELWSDCVEFLYAWKKIKIFISRYKLYRFWIYLCCVKFSLRLLVTKQSLFNDLSVFIELGEIMWKTERLSEKQKDFLFEYKLRTQAEHQVWIKLSSIQLGLWIFITSYLHPEKILAKHFHKFCFTLSLFHQFPRVYGQSPAWRKGTSSLPFFKRDIREPGM